jgi:hypothetical protein
VRASHVKLPSSFLVALKAGIKRPFKAINTRHPKPEAVVVVTSISRDKYVVKSRYTLEVSSYFLLNLLVDYN